MTSYVKRFGKPEPRAATGITVNWKGPESPIDSQELTDRSIDEVVQVLLEFKPSGDEFGPSKRGPSGRLLETDVKDRPEAYADKALLFARYELPFVYHTHLFAGLTSAAAEQAPIHLGNLLGLCQYVVDQEKDSIAEEEFEPRFPNAKFAAANLLKQLVRASHPGLDEFFQDWIGRIVLALLDQEDPLLKGETEVRFRSGNTFDQ